MFLLVPSGQVAALGYLIGALVNIFVWPAISPIPNYGNLPGFCGLTITQWGIICILLAF